MSTSKIFSNLTLLLLSLRESSKLIQGIIFALITIVIWVGFIIVARASSHGLLTGLDIATLRILGASVTLFPLGYWLNKNSLKNKSHTRCPKEKLELSSFAGLSPLSLRLTIKLGVPGGLMFAAFSYSGFFFAPAAHAAVLLQGSLPLWTTLIAWVILKNRIAGDRLIGVGFILVGDLLVGGPSLLNSFNSEGMWRGDALFILASFSWSYYAVMVRHHEVPPIHATLAITVFAFFTFLPIYFFFCLMGLLQSHILETSLSTIAFQMVFQGLLSAVISGITFNQMVRHFGPVRTTMFTAVVPGLGALGASIFLDEVLSLSVFLGLTLVTLGVLFGIGLRSSKNKLR